MDRLTQRKPLGDIAKKHRYGTRKLHHVEKSHDRPERAQSRVDTNSTE